MSAKDKHIDNLIERTLIVMPDADYDRVWSVAPVLNDMERSRLEQKIEYIRRKLKKKKGG
jgi:hypothetical protein